MQEVGEQKKPYVHAVDIGIGRDDDFVIAEVVNAVLYVERCTEQGKLIVFVNLHKGHAIGV